MGMNFNFYGPYVNMKLRNEIKTEHVCSMKKGIIEIRKSKSNYVAIGKLLNMRVDFTAG